MEIFQIPSGATKLSLTQSQSSNNLIRKLLLNSANVVKIDGREYA